MSQIIQDKINALQASYVGGIFINPVKSVLTDLNVDPIFPRFGIEDNTGVQNRSINMGSFTFDMSNSAKVNISTIDNSGYTSKITLDSATDIEYSPVYIESARTGVNSGLLKVDDYGAFLSGQQGTNVRGSISAAINGVYGSWKSSTGLYSGFGTSGVTTNGSFQVYGADGIKYNQGGSSSINPEVIPYVAHEFASDTNKGFLIRGMGPTQRLALNPSSTLTLNGLLVNQIGNTVGEQDFYYWNGFDKWYRMLAIDEANPTDNAATKMLVLNTTSNRVGVQNIPTSGGGGATVTANNGLTKTLDNIKLGGTLIENTTISAANNTLTITGTNGNTDPGTLKVLNSGTNGSAIYANAIESHAIIANSIYGSGIYAQSVNATAVYAQSNNVGVWGASQNSIGVNATSQNSTALFAQSYGSNNDSFPGSIFRVNNTNNTNYVASFESYNVSSLAAIGQSSKIIFKTSSLGTTNNNTSGSIRTTITDPNFTTYSTDLTFANQKNGVEVDVLTLLTNSQIKLNKYGLGTFTGTAVYNLATDALGNVIEVAAGGGSGTTPYELNLTTVGIAGAATYNPTTDTLNIPIPSQFWIEVTKAQLDTLISTNSLIKGATYRIDGVHPGLYDDGVKNTTLAVIQAIATNKLSSEGHGLFYNPLYTATAPFNIWNNRNTFVPSGIVGKFNQFEAITNNLGGTATLTSVAEEGFFTITGGTWVGATTITGTITAATANIASIVIKTFAIGEKTIWGGYVWSNVNGNVGASVNSLALNAEWTKIAFNLIDYDLVTDNIDYSYVDDKITRRVDVVSDNEVVYTPGDLLQTPSRPFHAINVFQWGNKYTGTKGTGGNDVINSYVDNINNQATYFSRNVFEQNAYYTNNTSIGIGVFMNIFTSGAFVNLNYIGKNSAIYSNHFGLNAAIRVNDLCNSSRIYSNRLFGAGYIGFNKCLAFVYIRENDMTGDSYIFNNIIKGGTGVCQIYGNSLFKAGYIRDNNIDTTAVAGTSYSIMNNVLYGGTGNFVKGFNNTTNPAVIGYNTLTGLGQIVENQVMSGEISYCNLTNSLINRCFLRNSSLLRNIVSTGFHIQKLEIGGMLVDYNNVPLTASSEDASYTQLESIYPISKIFDGTVDNGAIGVVNINNFTVPIGYFIKEVLVDVGAGLTGVGAIINFGLTVDSVNSGLNDTTGNIASLNSAGITAIYPTAFTKAAGIRRMYMDVKGAAITAGTITIKVKLTKLG